MNTSKLLVMVLVLQLLILAGQWTRQSTGTPAMAQVPDPGNQRIQMLEELKSLNGKVDKIVAILSEGDLQVRVVSDDEKK